MRAEMVMSSRGLELIYGFRDAGVSLPGNLSDIVCMRNPGNAVCQQYTGIYETFFVDGSGREYICYVKESDRLGKRFSFGDAATCREHIGIYMGLAGAGFYHPATEFMDVPIGDGRHGIAALMPHTVTRLCMRHKMGAFPQEKYDEKRKMLFSLGNEKIFHKDVSHEFNYGLADDGELYYIDLNLFHEVPFPGLSEMKRKLPTSA